MSNTNILIDRNRRFASNFSTADMPILPKLRTVILACGDARADPAHVLGLELGEAVTIRNNGGRVTQSVIEEIATLAFMVANMDGDEKGGFELILMQHTQCGAERFADPEFQSALKQHLGIDVSLTAICDHEESLKEDILRLRNAPEVPNYIIVSGIIYDVKTGIVSKVIAPAALTAQ